MGVRRKLGASAVRGRVAAQELATVFSPQNAEGPDSAGPSGHSGTTCLHQLQPEVLPQFMHL